MKFHMKAFQADIVAEEIPEIEVEANSREEAEQKFRDSLTERQCRNLEWIDCLEDYDAAVL